MTPDEKKLLQDLSSRMDELEKQNGELRGLVEHMTGQMKVHSETVATHTGAMVEHSNTLMSAARVLRDHTSAVIRRLHDEIGGGKPPMAPTAEETAAITAAFESVGGFK